MKDSWEPARTDVRTTSERRERDRRPREGETAAENWRLANLRRFYGETAVHGEAAMQYTGPRKTRDGRVAGWGVGRYHGKLTNA